MSDESLCNRLDSLLKSKSAPVFFRADLRKYVKKYRTKHCYTEIEREIIESYLSKLEM